MSNSTTAFNVYIPLDHQLGSRDLHDQSLSEVLLNQEGDLDLPLVLTVEVLHDQAGVLHDLEVVHYGLVEVVRHDQVGVVRYDQVVVRYDQVEVVRHGQVEAVHQE